MIIGVYIDKTATINGFVIADCASGLQVNTDILINNTAFVSYIVQPTYSSSDAIALNSATLTIANSVFYKYNNFPNSTIFRAYRQAGFSSSHKFTNTKLLESPNIYSLLFYSILLIPIDTPLHFPL